MPTWYASSAWRAASAARREGRVFRQRTSREGKQREQDGPCAGGRRGGPRTSRWQRSSSRARGPCGRCGWRFPAGRRARKARRVRSSLALYLATTRAATYSSIGDHELLERAAMAGSLLANVLDAGGSRSGGGAGGSDDVSTGLSSLARPSSQAAGRTYVWLGVPGVAGRVGRAEGRKQNWQWYGEGPGANGGRGKGASWSASAGVGVESGATP